MFGGSSDVPIAGDWNGDGIRSIGVFHNGKWHFDMDGDGISDKTAWVSGGDALLAPSAKLLRQRCERVDLLHSNHPDSLRYTLFRSL